MRSGRIGARHGGAGEAAGRGARDAGAAVVEFVMMSTLLIFLLFGVAQVAVYFYARNVVSAAAADGARYAANAGIDPSAGGPHARQLIAAGLSPRTAANVPCTGRAGIDAVTGLSTVTVRCRGHLRLLFLPLHAPLELNVWSTVLRETAP